MSKLSNLLQELEKAVNRFEEVLSLEKNDVVRDSAILRFEFTLDLSWKTVKAFLEEHEGVLCHSPKDCFRKAFQEGTIDYDDFWIELIDIRNELAHTYNDALSQSVYDQFPKALQHFKILLQKLIKK